MYKSKYFAFYTKVCRIYESIHCAWFIAESSSIYFTILDKYLFS